MLQLPGRPWRPVKGSGLPSQPVRAAGTLGRGSSRPAPTSQAGQADERPNTRISLVAAAGSRCQLGHRLSWPEPAAEAAHCVWVTAARVETLCLAQFS